MTELIALFGMTGHGVLAREESRPKPASLLLISDPGQGKTEVLERFRGNRFLKYESDLTVRGVWRLLKFAKHETYTHILATELQKFFQRRASVYENCFGVLCQAMEEGVFEVDVGQAQDQYEGARLGVIGACTNGTLRKRREFLAEIGFMDRAVILPWQLPLDEKRAILRKISLGDRMDLERIKLPVPSKPVLVDIPPKLSHRLEDYVWERWREAALRTFQRFRSLAMAAALLEGRDVVLERDLERAVYQFEDYWDRMVLS